MKKNITPVSLEGDVSVSFADFGLNDHLMKAIESAGFQTPSPIQAKVIPHILNGKDVVGQAKTGTGKTAAFALPALQFIEPRKQSVQLLVITPTRELASQVSDEIQRFGKRMDVKVVTVFGGSSYSRQIEGIRKGAQVVVATPGRLLDLLTSNRVPNMTPFMVVLDEADEMLDMGFLEDIKAIFEYLDDERQTLLFSATMPKPIQKLASQILKEPEFVSIESKGDMTNQDIEQRMCLVADHERDDAIARLIDDERPKKSIVFCRTRSDVDRVNHVLLGKGYACASLHGDIEQRQREKVINSFREGAIEILVATDVAARGLNVLDVSHVFNYHLPTNPETYVHRIGRTGRAGRKGVAFSLLAPSEIQRVRVIKRVTGGKISAAMIPSLRDIKKKRLSVLSHEIADSGVHEDAKGMVLGLLKGNSYEDIAMKLASVVLEQIHFSGPEKIGLPVDRLNELLNSDGGNQRRPERRGDRDGFRGGRMRRRRFSDAEPWFERKDREVVRPAQTERKSKGISERPNTKEFDSPNRKKPAGKKFPIKKAKVFPV